MPQITRKLIQDLRTQAGEALRVSKLVPEGTKAALEKIVGDLLREAVRLEKELSAEKPSDEA
jgi:hypothetical protein